MGCTAAEQYEIIDLAGAQAAKAICATMDVAAVGVTNAVLSYTLAASSYSMDQAFTLISGCLVFLMQAGFALVCAGSIRAKNTLNILLKNIMDTCTSAVCYYLIGFGLAYGHHPTLPPNGFIGNWDFALSETTKTGGLAFFFFQWAFNAAAATIVSGAVAERCSFPAYLGYSIYMSAIVYPIVSHWVWCSDGWLHASAARPAKDRLLAMGSIDFGGSGVVHLVGGVAAFWGAYMLGPRIGRFDRAGKPLPMRGHNATLVCLGSFLLWFGWYGFNCGSQLGVSGVSAHIVGRVATTTTMGGAAACLSSLFFVYYLDKEWNMMTVANGILGGLVSITSGCAVVEPWAALIAGTFGGIIYVMSERLLLRAQVDDPLSAIAIHAFCGAWGLLIPGFFATERYVEQVYGGDREPAAHFQGILYGGHGQILLCQVIEALCITAWVSVTMATFFFILKFLGLLRVPAEQELQGLDVSKHGGTAYMIYNCM